MADRKVTFTLGTAVDPSAKREAAELAALLTSIKSAADGATKSVREALSASSRGRGGPGGGSGGSGGPTGGRRPGGAAGGVERGYDRAAIDDLKRQRADERREREGILADRRKEAEAEKRILAERVRANVEAGRQIREAARATKAGNYQARAAGTYGAGFGRGGSPSGPSIPSDGDFKAHIEGVAKAYEAQERAANRAAAAHRKNVSDLVSGSKQAAAGVGNIARAFVYLGVSGEENVEKALRVLAKFEAGMAGIRGASDIAGGLAKAGKAYRGLGAGAGLAAGVGAVGLGATAALGAAALATGAGVGFGAARLYLGEQEFGNFTDWTGATDYRGERNAANRARVGTTAEKQIARRGRIAQRYADFDTMSGFDLADAEARGGLGGAVQESRRAIDAARSRSRDLESRIATGRAGNLEEFSAERVAAKQGEIAAMNTALQLEERRRTVLKSTVEAEREKTKAVREGLEASKASLGLADEATIRLAESGARKRNRGEKLTREEAGALGQFYGEAGQEEAAKLGADVLAKNPELARLADEIAKTRAANEKAVLVKVEQQLTGGIVVTPDSTKLKADIEAIIRQIEEERRQLLREEFEAARKDRESQEDLRRRSSGT